MIFAYIDPGSGALIWQAIVAGLVGVSYYFRKYLGRLFHKSRAEEQPPAEVQK